VIVPYLRSAGASLIATLRQHWPGVLVALAALTVYGICRHVEAYGCDAWSYVSQARLLRGIDVGLQGSLDPSRFRALIPLCYELVGRNLVPGMPPGFSAELALGGVFHIEGMVSPLVGGLSTFLIYFAAERTEGRVIGVVAALLWAAAPIVIWGATDLMGDLSAATALLLAHVLIGAKHPAAAGAAYGASLGIRPTNALFGPSALLEIGSWPDLLRFTLGAALGAGAWVAFGLGRYGGGSMFGMYGHNAQFVTYEAWQFQISFIAAKTATMFPLLLPLGAFAIWRRRRAELPLVVWALAIIGFYVGWRWKYDAWWWTRHVLPAYPALVLLGAHGLGECWKRLRSWPRALRAGGGLLVAANVAWCLWFAHDRGMLSSTNRDLWLRDSFELKKSLPRDSLVGGLNFSGPLRIYSGLESFRWDHDEAQKLIDYALKKDRPVYLLIEPSLYDTHPAALALRDRYFIKDVKQMRALHTVLRKIEPIGASAEHKSLNERSD
jgi:hypothetical protein